MKRAIPGNAAPTARAVVHVFGSRIGLLAVIAILFGSLAGCGGQKKFGDSDDDTQTLIRHIRSTYLRAGQPIEVTTAKIKNTEKISDDLYRVEFDAEATLVKGTYAQIDKGRILRDAGWSETAYVAAVQQARNLPSDVRAELEKIRPAIDNETRFFRREANEGEKLKFDGRCTARFQVTAWTVADLELKELTPPESSALALYDLNQYKVSILPPNSWEISGRDGQLRVSTLVAAQKKYCAAVTEAAAKAAKEQSDSAAKLEAVAVTGKTWTASLPDGNRPIQKWIIEFIEVSGGDALKALIRHPTDELRRRVYAGRVISGDVASIALEPLEGAGGLIYGGNYEVIRIRAAADGGLRIFVNDKVEGKLEATPAVATTKPESELWTELLKRIEPGSQWTGTTRSGTDAAVPIKLTFVDVKPDGSYVRAVGETPNDPVTTVVFEGIANRAGVHGWPIVMKAIDSYAAETQLRDFFSPGNSTLVLAMFDDRLIGQRGADGLQLTTNSKVEPWAGRDQVAKKIFAPGVKLTGRTAGADGSAEVDLMVADVRDNGAYVRVLAQPKEDPYESVVYEGRFPFNTSLIDGYALELVKRSSLMRPETLFREESATTLRLRLALDGSSVVGILLVNGRPQETLTLKVDEARKAAVNTATQPFAEYVKQLLVKNSQWRGTLRDIRESRSAEVTMRITDVNLADGITVEFIVPRTAGARVVYEGLLQLGDLTVNSGCASLRKTVGGKIDQSAMFDPNIGEDRKMKFVLAPDGLTLHVHTTNSSGERLEQLSLKPISIQRPATLNGGKPTGTAPTSSGTRPVSGLLRPVTP